MRMLADIHQAQEAFYGMGTLLFFMIAVVVAAAAFLGVLWMVMAVAPGLTQRSAEALGRRNFVSFLAGLPFFGLLILFGLLGKVAPAAGGLGVLALSVFFLVGLAAASEDIGRRLFWACGREGSRASHLAAGWALFFCAAWLPFVGWFVVLPYFAFAGLGSIVVGMVSSRKAPDSRLATGRETP